MTTMKSPALRDTLRPSLHLRKRGARVRSLLRCGLTRLARLKLTPALLLSFAPVPGHDGQPSAVVPSGYVRCAASTRKGGTKMPADDKRMDGTKIRSLALDIGAVATPVVIAAQPLISAWADTHIGQGGDENQTPPEPQQQQPQDDS
jgi:hypothetical protein